MKQKEIAQRIMAMYHTLASDEERAEFIQLLKDIIKIIDRMSQEDFERFVDDFERHLNEIDHIKDNMGLKG